MSCWFVVGVGLVVLVFWFVWVEEVWFSKFIYFVVFFGLGGVNDIVFCVVVEFIVCLFG